MFGNNDGANGSITVPKKRPKGNRFSRATLGYFYNTPHRGRGLTILSPLISETTGPILKLH